MELCCVGSKLFKSVFYTADDMLDGFFGKNTYHIKGVQKYLSFQMFTIIMQSCW